MIPHHDMMAIIHPTYYLDGVLSVERENYFPLSPPQSIRARGDEEMGRAGRVRTNNASSPPLPSPDHSINLASLSDGGGQHYLRRSYQGYPNASRGKYADRSDGEEYYDEEEEDSAEYVDGEGSEIDRDPENGMFRFVLLRRFSLFGLMCTDPSPFCGDIGTRGSCRRMGRSTTTSASSTSCSSTTSTRRRNDSGRSGSCERTLYVSSFILLILS